MELIRNAVIALLLMVSSISMPAARAENFPNRPVTIQLVVSPGGPTDRQFRVLAKLVSKHLGQPVIIENKTGASGTLAVGVLALTGKPDGYTLVQIQPSAFRLPQMQKVKWNPLRDLTYVVGIGSHVLGVAVRTDSPFKTWDDIAQFARAHPGQVTYATTGVGGTMHLMMKSVEVHTGLKFNHIPYRGLVESTQALLAGDVMLTVDAVSGFANLAQAGKVRILMVWEPKRYANMPDIPTAKELGLNIVRQSTFGLAGPKGMPSEVVATLNHAFKQAMNEPEYLKIMSQYHQVSWYQTPADYSAYSKEAYEAERVQLEQAGLLAK